MVKNNSGQNGRDQTYTKPLCSATKCGKNLAPLAATTQVRAPPSAAHAARGIDHHHRKGAGAAERPTGAAVAIAFDGVETVPDRLRRLPDHDETCDHDITMAAMPPIAAGRRGPGLVGVVAAASAECFSAARRPVWAAQGPFRPRRDRALRRLGEAPNVLCYSGHIHVPNVVS